MRDGAEKEERSSQSVVPNVIIFPPDSSRFSDPRKAYTDKIDQILP